MSDRLEPRRKPSNPKKNCNFVGRVKGLKVFVGMLEDTTGVIDHDLGSVIFDDPKRHYGFKPGLLGKSVSLGVDISNWEMFDDDWGLESTEVSPLGEELSLFDRPNEVDRGRILEAHRLEPILQQQISQCMAPSHHDDRKRHHRDLSSDDVKNSTTASGHGRLKEDLESSTWRRRQNF
ncbi:hypothetical protein Tco_0351191 [Tanacetum coccineum]